MYVFDRIEKDWVSINKSELKEKKKDNGIMNKKNKKQTEYKYFFNNYKQIC